MTFRKVDFCCPQDRFVGIVKKAGVSATKVIPVKGWYEQSLTCDVKRDHRLNRAAVIHVDCDLYSSTAEVLTFIEDVVQPGTIITFDDGYVFRDEKKPEDFGEQKAFNQWALRHAFQDFYEFSTTKAFIMTATRRSSPIEKVEVGPRWQ